ncbi:hypothetical protein KJ885_04360 [Patescibacteria group bacterium]|nr:hypothetical protein [Patescibacteria group bacterium]
MGYRLVCFSRHGGSRSTVDNFCGECGERLLREESTQCNCGHLVGLSDNFCPGCGEKTIKEAEEMRKNSARLDDILKRWGYSIPRTEDDPQAPIEKVKQLVRELKEFIATLPPASQGR